MKGSFSINNLIRSVRFESVRHNRNKTKSAPVALRVKGPVNILSNDESLHIPKSIRNNSPKICPPQID